MTSRQANGKLYQSWVASSPLCDPIIANFSLLFGRTYIMQLLVAGLLHRSFMGTAASSVIPAAYGSALCRYC
jgi:hypothetical protein